MAGLTDDQVKLVKANWAEVKKIKDVAADLFYDKLFELDPSLRELFKEDITIQKKALMATISFCVATLNHPDKLIPAVQELGARHGKYGVDERSPTGPLAQPFCGHLNRVFWRCIDRRGEGSMDTGLRRPFFNNDRGCSSRSCLKPRLEFERCEEAV